MVKKHFCDRCEKEIDVASDDLFDLLQHNIEASLFSALIVKPQLCKKCKKGYKKIIKETNKKIAGYISQ